MKPDSSIASKHLKRLAIAFLMVTAGFIGGTIFGINFYSSLSMFSNLVPKGLIAAVRLQQLEQGNLKRVKMDLEHDIDSALAEYSFVEEEWWFPLYQDDWLLLETEKFEEYIKKTATYRKSHPSPYRNAFKDMTDEWLQNTDNQELMVFDRDYWKRVDEMVNKYAKN